MGAESAEHSGQQDPVVERAEKALQRIENHETDRVGALDDKIKDLMTRIEEVDKEIGKAEKDVTPKGTDRWDQLKKIKGRLETRLREVEARKTAVQQNAEGSEQRVLGRVAKKEGTLTEQGNELKAQDPEYEANLAKLQVLKAEEADLLRQATAASTPEERKALLKSLDAKREEIKKIETQDHATDKLDRARELKEGRERLEAKERAEDFAKAEESLSSLDEPSGDKRELMNDVTGLTNGMAKGAERTIRELVKQPINKDDVLGRAKFNMKKLWARIKFAFSPQEITWDKDMSESDKTKLADAGITFIHDEKKGTSTIKWDKTPKEFGVDETIAKVMGQHLGDAWYLKFRSLETTDTVASLRAQIPAGSKKPEDIAVLGFIEEMEANGIGDKPVVEWLKENAYKMDDELAAKKKEAADKKAQETQKTKTPGEETPAPAPDAAPVVAPVAPPVVAPEAPPVVSPEAPPVSNETKPAVT